MSHSLRAYAKTLRTFLGLERREQLAAVRRPQPRKRRKLLGLEELEDRTLLSVSFTAPEWTPQGPAPALYGQSGVGPDNRIAGAIEAIAIDPGPSHFVYVGTVNGGVWRTDNIFVNNPVWTPLTDQFPSLSIGSL